MANISCKFSNLILTLGLFKNKVDHCRNIVDTHLLKVKLPELFLFWVESSVNLRVVVASIISKPNIIASLGQNKAQTIVVRVHYPCSTTVQ